MRADMGKVLVERPRVGSRHLHGMSGKGYKSRVRREMASEDGSRRREGMKRLTHGGHKHFNEHLGPLRRYLDSNVGRPWDKVHSEICQHINRGNVVQKHILTHLFEYVVVDVELIDGELYHKARCRSACHTVSFRGPLRWYVCPKSGLLLRAEGESKQERRKRWRIPQPQPPVGWADADHCVCRAADGRWLLVRVARWVPADAQPGPKRVYHRDVLLDCDDANRVWRFYGKKVFAVEVRPLKASELKELPVTLPGTLTAPNVVR